jgi:hypothetical protein
MRRRVGCAALLIASVMLAPGAPAAAQLLADAQLTKKNAVAQAATKSSVKPSAIVKGQPIWKFYRAAGVATLEYGVTGGEVVISFSCQPGTELLRVISQIGSRGLRPGDGAAILLMNGKTRVEIAGTAFSTQSREAVDIAAATRVDPKLFALFRTGDTLIVDVPGRRRTLTLSGARASTGTFEKACTAGKQPPTG